MSWEPIDTLQPYVTVLLFRLRDLYPVVGWRMGDPAPGEEVSFYAEENGPEDGAHRRYPALSYLPTHWRPLSVDVDYPPEARA